MVNYDEQWVMAWWATIMAQVKSHGLSFFFMIFSSVLSLASKQAYALAHENTVHQTLTSSRDIFSMLVLFPFFMIFSFVLSLGYRRREAPTIAYTDLQSTVLCSVTSLRGIFLLKNESDPPPFPHCLCCRADSWWLRWLWSPWTSKLSGGLWCPNYSIKGKIHFAPTICAQFF